MSLAQPATVDDLLNYRLSTLLDSSGSLITRLCEGRYGITRREWRLIALLAAHGDMSPSELAERAHMERARVSRLITALVDKRLFARRTLAADRRRASVGLTANGQALYDELFPQSVRFTQLVLQALDPAELAAFDEALSRLRERAEQLGREPLLEAKADRRHGGSRRLAGR
jgi:DNA-binding MarR family transcriptional regulator